MNSIIFPSESVNWSFSILGEGYIINSWDVHSTNAIDGKE